MQFRAIIDTLNQVFTGQVVLIIFCCAAAVVLLLAGILVVHVKKCDPVKGSMDAFIKIYAAGTVILLCAAAFAGIQIL